MAVAGKVAITPKGNWNANTAYQKLDLVFYENASYVAIQPSTGVIPTDESHWMLVVQSAGGADFEGIINGEIQVGNAKTLDGHGAEYFATADGLNSIQSTSKATLSQAGWYRVAESSNNYSTYDFTITLSKGFSSYQPEIHRINVVANSYYSDTRIDSTDVTGNKQAITKFRVVKTNDKQYAEVYIGINVREAYDIAVYNSNVSNVLWKAVTPTLTSETVDGVTVTTTYDIPANASPVTDLDLAQVDGTTLLNTSILEKALTLETGVYQFKLAGNKYTGNDLPHADYKYGNATVYVWDKESNILVALWGTAYVTTPTAMQFYGNNGWRSNWVINTTTADLIAELAKYLPLDGSKVLKSILFIGSEYEAGSRTLVLQNNKRKVLITIDENGKLSFWDSTNSKSLVSFSVDGATNTFNGTASGNLPINSDGKITRELHVQKADNGYTRIMKNNSATADYGTRIYDVASDGKQAGFGWSAGSKTPYFVDSTGKESGLLHTGNSAKVHIGTSAPSDTSALWIDTSA